MPIKNNVLSVLMICAICTSPMLFAANHTDMNYQGRLTDASGNPVADATYDITFSIWDDSTSGNQLWSQVKPVQTNSGMINTMLQEPFGFLFGAAAPPSNGPFFLQIQIGADPPVSPRSRFGMVYGSILSHRVEGDIMTQPGMLEVHPPEPGAVRTPGFRLEVNSAVSNWKLFPSGAVTQEDTCGGMEGTVSTELVQLDLSSPPNWGGPCDSIPDITLKTDGNENVVRIGSTIDSSTAIQFIADSTVHYLAFYHPPLDDADPSTDIPPFNGVKLSSAAFRNALEMNWHPPEPGMPSAASLMVDSIQSSLGLRFDDGTGDSSSIALASNSVGSSVNIYGGFPPDDSQPQINMVSDTGGSVFWLGSIDGSAAMESMPVISMQTGSEANFNFGYAGSVPPDDGAPAPDDAKPGLSMNANATTSSLSLHGPDPGAAPAKRIVMTADGTEARIGINTDAPTSALYVDGDIVATGSITELSDMRLKENVTDIEDAIDIISQIRGVQFEWRKDQNEFSDLPDGQRVGLIAQEIEKILPEAVLSPEDGYKSVDYSRLTPVLVQAIKEQQQQIDELRELVYQLSKGSKEQTNK